MRTVALTAALQIEHVLATNSALEGLLKVPRVVSMFKLLLHVVDATSEPVVKKLIFWASHLMADV